MPATLEYAAMPPTRRICVTRHDDGIAIRFPRPLWRAAIQVISDFAEGGLEGLLVLVLSPVFVLAAVYFGFLWGFGLTTLALLLVGVGVIVFAVLRLAVHEGGPEIVVRAGRVTFRDSKVQDEPLRECATNDVVAVETGDARPIIRKRGGNELLGGFDAIEVGGYRQLSRAAKRCVTQMLRDAIGLPSSSDDATSETIG